MKKTAPAFLLIAACAGLLAAAPAGATFPGRPGLIAFDGSGSIWTVSPDHHGSPHKLAGGTDPAFSPDGRLLAFMRGGRLMVIRSDGSGERLLYRAEGTSDPCFAADGKHIFFKHDTSGEGYADLYSIPLAGGPAHRLTHTGSRSSEIDSEAPEAAPNGRFVAFQRNEWIWTMRPDGSNQRRLTRGANPSISPDSDQVVASRGESLVVIGAAGGHERVVHPITRKKQFGELIRSAGWPVFSPDGRSIAFTYKRIVSAGPGNHASGRLAVFSLATGKLRILTGPALGGRHASWQSLR